jgi:hypothetical protein
MKGGLNAQVPNYGEYARQIIYLLNCQQHIQGVSFQEDTGMRLFVSVLRVFSLTTKEPKLTN